MDDIILPWSCKTQDKVLSICFRILGWIILISTPLTLIHFMIIFSQYKTNPPVDIILILELCYGILGTMFSWFLQIAYWYEQKKLPRLPRFKCKCEDDKN